MTHIGKRATLFSALFFTVTANASADIKFHEADKNLYVVELVSNRNIGEKESLKIIADASKTKCGGLPAILGPYRFSAQEPVSSGSDKSTNFKMVQQLLCGQLPEVKQAPTPSVTKAEVARLESEAGEMTNKYLDHLFEAGYESAYSMLSSALMENKPYENWVVSRKEAAFPEGELQHSEVWRVTTYIDPPNSPQKGIFIAADFERQYSDFPVVCGYIAWYLEEGELKLIREDLGMIDLKMFGGMKEIEIAQTKAKFRCNPSP